MIPIEVTDTLLMDLDGVVYRGGIAVPHAVESLNRAAAEGVRVGYITNNASRTAATVAGQLSGYGLRTVADDVVTSPQAAVRLLASKVPAPATILVVGGEGLTSVLDEAGYTVTRSADDNPAAVLQGFHPSVGWAELAEAAFAIQANDLLWIATNTDWTIPLERGIAPGNGTLVSAVHTAVGKLAEVAGKPERAIFDAAVERFAAQAPLVVGDRLDTDILGANNAQLPSAHVLTGIDGAKQLLAAPEGQRPNFILDDLRELFEPYPETVIEGRNVRVRNAVLHLAEDESTITVVERGDNPTDLLRAGCAIIWASGRLIYGFDVPTEIYDWDPRVQSVPGLGA
jgi:glycerol 3-phosphatase-2